MTDFSPVEGAVIDRCVSVRGSSVLGSAGKLRVNMKAPWLVSQHRLYDNATRPKKAMGTGGDAYDLDGIADHVGGTTFGSGQSIALDFLSRHPNEWC
jgi:hypothetical protein